MTTKATATAPELVPNAFAGQKKKPTNAELTAALGATRVLWDRLLSDLAELGADAQEWHSYSPKYGWSLKLKRGERTIVYLAPCPGCFRVAFVLGDKALDAVRGSCRDARLTKLLKDAKKYPEGTAVRLIVSVAPDLAIVKPLAQAKLDH